MNVERRSKILAESHIIDNGVGKLFEEEQAEIVRLIGELKAVSQGFLAGQPETSRLDSLGHSILIKTPESLAGTVFSKVDLLVRRYFPIQHINSLIQTDYSIFSDYVEIRVLNSRSMAIEVKRERINGDGVREKYYRKENIEVYDFKNNLDPDNIFPGKPDELGKLLSDLRNSTEPQNR